MAASGACLISPIAPSRKSSTSAPCHRWSPANTSWTRADRGRAELLVERPRAAATVAVAAADREDRVLGARSRRAADGARPAPRRRGARATPSCPGSTCEPHMFHGTVCAAAPRREVAGHDRGARPGRRARRGTACTSRRTRARRPRCGRASTSGCAASTSSARPQVPEVALERHDAGHRGAHEVPVAVVLVVGHPVGALAEAAEVGREHDVAGASRAGARSRRPRRPATRPHTSALPGPCPWIASTAGSGPRSRSCGTSRYAGTDIVRFGVEDDAVAAVRAAVDRLGRSRRRAAPGPGSGPSSARARASVRARHASNCSGSSTGHGSARRPSRAAGASTPSRRSCDARVTIASSAQASPPARWRRYAGDSHARREVAEARSRTRGPRLRAKHHASG